MKTFLYLLLTSLMLGSMSCKHDTDKIDPGPDPEQSQGVERPIGTSLGASVNKQIGPDGGSLTSADGTLTITVPVGALTALTEVGIQPITSTCPGGIGDGWRLTPHGKAFAKPVQLKLNYTAQKDSVALPQALGLAYQDDKDVWRFVGATSVNATAHTLTMQTNHFSDWGLMSWMTLSPIAQKLHAKEQLIIKALQYFHVTDDELHVPLGGVTYENGYPVGGAHQLPDKYIKKWSLAGPGSLQELSSVSKATYTAPAQIQKTQTVAVSLELKGFKEQAILVSNLTLIGKEPTIEYMQVAEQTGPNGRNSELIIYGSNFGAQDKAKSSITINGEIMGNQDIGLWGDNIIVCRIPAIGPNSSGNVIVRTATGGNSEPHLLNEWTVAMQIKRPCGRVGQSLYEAGTAFLRIRGDASTPPQNLAPLLNDDAHNTVNFTSYVHWEAGGEGHSRYNNEESCGSENEQWAASKGDIYLTTGVNTSDKESFKVALYHLPGKGFDVSFTYEAVGVVPVTFVFTPCKGDVVRNNRPYTVHFPSEFHEERFPLLFNGNVLKGGQSERHTTGVGSSNLHFDISDAPNWKHELRLTWSDTKAKY